MRKFTGCPVRSRTPPGNEGEQMEVVEQKSDMVRCVDPNIPSG